MNLQKKLLKRNFHFQECHSQKHFLDKSLQKKLKSTGNIDAAKEVGKLIAKRALEAGVQTVAFDRSGFIYHGRIKALADAAREVGLVF